MNHSLPLFGAFPEENGVLFRVLAQNAARVDLVLEGAEQDSPMERVDEDSFQLFVENLRAGARYRYRLDGAGPFPDPASRYQPQGVHGPSEVVDPSAYAWRDDDWKDALLSDLVIYELHLGTFSPQGGYRGVVERLPYLKQLGVTAIELMPIAEFPGRWNWGYDGAALYAPFHGYGSPDELRELVDEAHQLGIAVLLDVVYNHFGPDGSYATLFGAFLTDKHRTVWGKGVNFDDLQSRGVRSFFIDNALYWLREFHFDGLRLDATDTLVDDSQPHFLAELSAAVERLPGPKRLLIAEDSRNDATLVRPRAQGGYGLDAIWSDDFHHQIRNLTTGDANSYFADFTNTTAEGLGQTLRQGWFFTGQHSPRRKKPRGTPTEGVAPEQFVFCVQNHDQIGNRPTGRRLHHDTSLSLYRAISSLLLFAPQTPLLFMGQEWAAETPFLFFTDHHAELGKLVTEGRMGEFSHFVEHTGAIPDPQSSSTFENSRLRWEELNTWPHREILTLYHDLLALRRRARGKLEVEVHGERALTLHRGPHHLLVSLDGESQLPPPRSSELDLLFYSEIPRYGGIGGSPWHEGEFMRFNGPVALLFVDREQVERPAILG